MFVSCATCGTTYDDAARWTICPHSPLGGQVDDLCPRCDTLKSVHGPCAHQLGKVTDNNGHPVISAAQRSRESIESFSRTREPQWRDSPSCPGLWLIVWQHKTGESLKHLTAEMLTAGAPYHAERVFGPIPEDQP